MITFKYLTNNTKIMELNRTILMGVYVIITLYIVYRIFIKKNPNQDDYERMYNKILNSDKYKVKGQYDREE